MAILYVRRAALRVALCFLFVNAFLGLSQKSHAVIQPADGNRPIIIFLDGIAKEFSFSTRIENYLMPALKEAWGYYGDTAETLSVPWTGDLSDYPQLLSYISLTKALIISTINKYPTRPIVVVGHSWGSVVAYQVFTQLQSALDASGRRIVNSDAIALFVSLGSPLASTRTLVLNAVRTVASAKGAPVPGQEFVDTKRSGVVLRKPDVVGYWINYWIYNSLSYNDPIADKKEAADENVRGTALLLPFASHAAYYEQRLYTSWERDDIKRILDYDCRNVYTSASAVPSGYGAAYNVLVPDKELLVKVTCHGAYRQPLTTAQRTPGAVVVVGSGRLTEEIYEKSAVWKNNAWQYVQLSGARKLNGFFPGEARADLPFTGSELVSGNRNYVAGYVCQAGKCGCADATCATHLWQLQSLQR